MDKGLSPTSPHQQSGLHLNRLSDSLTTFKSKLKTHLYRTMTSLWPCPDPESAWCMSVITFCLSSVCSRSECVWCMGVGDVVFILFVWSGLKTFSNCAIKSHYYYKSYHLSATFHLSQWLFVRASRLPCPEIFVGGRENFAHPPWCWCFWQPAVNMCVYCR